MDVLMHTHTNGYAHPCTHMCTASLGTWFAVVPKGVGCCHSYAEYKKGGESRVWRETAGYRWARGLSLWEQDL